MTQASVSVDSGSTLQTFEVFVYEMGVRRVVGFTEAYGVSRNPAKPGVQSKMPRDEAAFLHVPVLSRLKEIRLIPVASEGPLDKDQERDLVRGITWASDRLAAGALTVHYAPGEHQVLPVGPAMYRGTAPTYWPRYEGDDPDERNRAREEMIAVQDRHLSELPPLQPGHHLYPLHINVADTDFGAFEHVPGVLIYWTMQVVTAPVEG